MLVDGGETERLVGATSQDQLVGMFQRATRLRAQSPDVRSQAAAQPAAQPATQLATADPWSSVGNAELTTSGSPGGTVSNPGGTNAPARPMTHTAPLGPREPLQDAFSNELIRSSVRLRVDD